jgi:hypothetical protein
MKRFLLVLIILFISIPASSQVVTSPMQTKVLATGMTGNSVQPFNIGGAGYQYFRLYAYCLIAGAPGTCINGGSAEAATVTLYICPPSTSPAALPATVIGCGSVGAITLNTAAPFAAIRVNDAHAHYKVQVTANNTGATSAANGIHLEYVLLD